MPKLTELTSAGTLSNSDLLVVTTNTAGQAVSNSVNVATLATAVSAATPLFIMCAATMTSAMPRSRRKAVMICTAGW